MEYAVCGGQHLSDLFMHSFALFVGYFIWTGEVDLHVLMNSTRSFRVPAQFTAVAPLSCFLQPHLMPYVPTRSLHRTLTCLPRRTRQQMATAIRPLFTHTTSSSLHLLSSHCHTLALLCTSPHCCPCHIGTVGKLSSTSTILFLLVCLTLPSPPDRHLLSAGSPSAR